MREELKQNPLDNDRTSEEEKASYTALIDCLANLLTSENTNKSIDKDNLEL